MALLSPPVAVGFGRPALDELARAVASAQTGRPLARVSILVESNLVALSVRRSLGARGVANVATTTAHQLARSLWRGGDLGGPPRPELTDTVVRAAVRRALAEDATPFGVAAGHPATEARAAALYGELAPLSGEARAALAGDPVGRAALDLSGRIGAHLDGYLDESALVDAAIEALGRPERVEGLGQVVWYLPGRAGPAVTRFVAAVLAAAPSRVVVGLTGVADADRAVRATVDVVVEAASGRAASTAPPPTAAPVGVHEPAASRIVSASDPDEEVRAVVRAVLGLAADGVPLHRVGIFATVADPYLSLLAAHLERAGLAPHGPSTTTLGNRIVGRTLLAALDLDRRRWTRRAVLALAAGAPVQVGGVPAPTHAWDALSREAGVVQGRHEWTSRLAALATHTTGPGSEVLADLARFVADLMAAVDRVDHARTWAGRAGAAIGLVDVVLGEGWPADGWPEPERRAATQVREALARLAALDALDALEPWSGSVGFARALRAELDVAADRHGTHGTGVQFGLLAHAPGQDLDAVLVVGLAEGSAPVPRRADELLPDPVRGLARGELARARDALHEQHRHLLATLATAPPERRILSFPRGDMRSGRTRRPSRWLAPTASALAGRPIGGGDLEHLGSPAVEVVASFAAGLAGSALHVDADHEELALLVDHTARGARAADHAAAARARPGLEALAARRSAAFSAFDGNLGGSRTWPGPARVGPSSESMLSPTRLETWAICGFRYLLGPVLGLGRRDDPDRIIELGPRERGSLVHEILHRFVSEAIAGGPPAPDRAWSDGARRRLGEIAEQVFAETEARGLTGRPLRWQVERGRLRDELALMLDADDEFRRTERATPVATELAFGLEGLPPVTVDLGDGRQVRLRGRADRVDRTVDGRILVSDYKSGRGDRFRGLGHDPVLGGTALQLGAYAEAALATYDADTAEAHYWSTATGARHGYPWTPDRRDRFVEVVRAVVDGIEAGTFDAVPGEWDTWRRTHETCTHCEFDSVCPVDRGDHAARRLGAPEVAVRRRLAPTDAGSEAG